MNRESYGAVLEKVDAATNSMAPYLFYADCGNFLAGKADGWQISSYRLSGPVFFRISK